jgi:hypothetical protein
MDYNLLIAILGSSAIAAVIIGLTFLFSHNSRVKGYVDILVKLVPQLLEAAKGVVDPKQLDKLEKVEKLVIMAVNAVEKISQKTDMTSEEKKVLAIDYFDQLANEFELPELTEIQRKTLDIIIENAILEADKGIEKKVTPLKWI